MTSKPVPPTPYVAPNRLIWRIADILAAHKGQASWRQLVAVTRDFEGEWASMAPGEKTKRMFYADDRAFWFVYAGAMRVHLEGQKPFLIEGEQLVTGTVGDVVHAPNERWHRASFHGTGMATRVAITPRNKEGQLHYTQSDVQESAPSRVRPPRP